MKKTKTNKKIVLHIIHGFSVGGAEKIVLDYLYQYLNDQEFDVYALIIDRIENNAFINQINSVKDKIFEFNYANKKRSLFGKLISRFKAQLFILKTIQRLKPDIVHSHLDIIHLIMLPLIFYPKIDRFHTIHSDVNNLVTKRSHKIYDKIYIKYMNCIPIAINKKMMQDVNNFYSISHTTYVYNGIDFSKFNNSVLDKKNDNRDILEIPKKSIVMGHIGRFSHEKNQIFLVRILYELLKIDTNFHLILVGDGNEKDEVLKLSETLNILEHIHIYQSSHNVPFYLATFDFFLFPSIIEGLGISVIEAQACGLKCIISNSVPKEVIVSKSTRQIDIQLIDDWVKYIQNWEDNESTEIYTTIDEFNIKTTLQLLNNIYNFKKRDANNES